MYCMCVVGTREWGTCGRVKLLIHALARGGGTPSGRTCLHKRAAARCWGRLSWDGRRAEMFCKQVAVAQSAWLRPLHSGMAGGCPFLHCVGGTCNDHTRMLRME